MDYSKLLNRANAAANAANTYLWTITHRARGDLAVVEKAVAAAIDCAGDAWAVVAEIDAALAPVERAEATLYAWEAQEYAEAANAALAAAIALRSRAAADQKLALARVADSEALADQAHASGAARAREGAAAKAKAARDRWYALAEEARIATAAKAFADACAEAQADRYEADLAAQAAADNI